LIPNEELKPIKYAEYKKTRTHEKPFVLNNVFRAAASNVSSGSLPAGSAVLQKETRSFRKIRIKKYRNTIWNDLKKLS
jgi:hypothetical protein